MGDTYDLLKKCLLPKKPGRPPDPPKNVPLTKLLLVQLTKRQLSQLLKRLRTKETKKTAVKEALKNEIRYQTVVLRKKGKLRLAGSVKDLSNALTDHLPAEGDSQGHMSGSLTPSEDLDTDSAVNPTQQEQSPPQFAHNSSEEPEELQRPFAYTNQGQWVAVYFTEPEGYYIGQVTEVYSPDSALVQYLTETPRRGVFKWPKVDQVQATNAVFVFRWDIDVRAGNRQWIIHGIEDIENAYREIRSSLPAAST